MTTDARTLVLTDTRDEGGTTWRAVTLRADDSLTVRGQDLGPAVERHFGSSEHEFARSWSVEETARLAAALDVGVDDLLRAIGERFAHTHELERYARDQGLPGSFWSRVGD